MWILSLTMLSLFAQTLGINLIDLPNSHEQNIHKKVILRRSNSPKVSSTTKATLAAPQIRNWLFRQSDIKPQSYYSDDENDANIKSKITTLVQQSVFDTDRKIKSIQYLKDRQREQPPYRIGFILSMIKKSRDVMNELFNVAVKHRDEWIALEQLKIFELIVHTNVDMTNLVRQLVEIHIGYLNSTSNNAKLAKRSVVLL